MSTLFHLTVITRIVIVSNDLECRKVKLKYKGGHGGRKDGNKCPPSNRVKISSDRFAKIWRVEGTCRQTWKFGGFLCIYMYLTRNGSMLRSNPDLQQHKTPVDPVQIWPCYCGQYHRRNRPNSYSEPTKLFVVFWPSISSVSYPRGWLLGYECEMSQGQMKREDI